MRAYRFSDNRYIKGLATEKINEVCEGCGEDIAVIETVLGTCKQCRATYSWKPHTDSGETIHHIQSPELYKKVED